MILITLFSVMSSFSFSFKTFYFSHSHMKSHLDLVSSVETDLSSSPKSMSEKYVFWWILVFLTIWTTNLIYLDPWIFFSLRYAGMALKLRSNWSCMKCFHFEDLSRYLLVWFTSDFLIIFGLNSSIIQQTLIKQLVTWGKWQDE